MEGRLLERTGRSDCGRSRSRGRTGGVCALPTAGPPCIDRPIGGYCYLNNAAIAARWLQGENASRVAIVDIDTHHGNGTQEIFYADASVLTCSLHADPDVEYPYYWGGPEEVGVGAGIGYNRNWPLPPRTNDEAYLVALDEALDSVRAFAPEVLVISAGFDLIDGDPSAPDGGLAITPAGLGEIARRLASLDTAHRDRTGRRLSTRSAGLRRSHAAAGIRRNMSATQSTLHVNSEKLANTIHTLCLRVGERFPGSGLQRVCNDLYEISLSAEQDVLAITSLTTPSEPA